MAKVQPLHMAKSLEELNKKITHDKIKQAAPKLLCKTAEKIFLKARDAKLQDRDEEQAYVLFMRFLDVVSCIRKSREYKSSKREFDKLLPTARFTQALEEAEELAKCLEERYLELSKPADKKPRFEDDLNTDYVVPSSPGKPLSAQQLYKQSKPLVPQQASTLGDLDERWFGNQSSISLLDTHKASTSSFPTLSPQQLYEYLQNSPEEVLVLDCRPRAEYNASHVDNKRFPQWLSVPEEMVKKGVGSENVLGFLPAAGKKYWKERDKKQWVVLVDDDSTADALPGSPNNIAILSLKDALHKWDTTIKQEPFILEGGYAMWYLTYSPLCTGVYKKKEGNRTEGEVSVQKQQPESVDYPSLPNMSESAVQDEELTSEREGAAEINPLPDQAATYQDSSNQNGQVDSLKQTNDSGGQEYVIQSPPDSTPSAPPLEQASTMLPTIAASQILPTYAPLPPPPSAIPVALTLEGESALLTPTLSTDNILSDVPELDPVVPNTTGSTLPVSQQHNFQPQFPVVANGQHLPQTYHNQLPGYPPEATEAQPPPLVGPFPQQPTPLGISAQANHAQGMLNDTSYQTNRGTYFSHPNEPTAQTAQRQDPHYFTAQYPHNASGGSAFSAPPPQVIHPHPQHVPTQVAQPNPHVQSQVAQPHPHVQSQVSQPHPQYAQTQVSQPHPHVQTQLTQPNPHVQSQVAQPHPHVQSQVSQPHPQYAQTQVSQPHPHVQTQLTQPYPQQMQTQVAQPHPHVQTQSTQPYPQQMQTQVAQPHPHVQTQVSQPHPHVQTQFTQPYPQQMQTQFTQSHPQQVHAPPPQIIQPHSSAHTTQSPPQSWVQQPASAPTATNIQIPPHQLGPMPTQPTQNLPNPPSNPRVVNGPIPTPPTYGDSHQLPSCPPVQPPIPPPVSITQPNRFSQQNASQEHATPATQERAKSDSDLLAKEARIQELERRLAEKNEETHSEREQTEKAMEDFKQKQERERRELLEQLESERRKLEEVKYRDSELERQREALQLQLQQEKAQHAQELERERQALAQTREQYERAKAEQQQELLQLKAQFERERTLVQQQQKEMLQHLQLRKQQENERMFSVSQGMPAGWEKRLDPGTGRFYYMDHNTKTTHWNPPTNWLAYQQRQKEMQEQQRKMIQPLPGGEQYLQPGQVPPGQVPPGQVPPRQVPVPPGQVPPGMSAVAQIPRQQPPASTPHPSLQPQQVVPPVSGHQTIPVQPPPRQVGAPQQPVPTSIPQRVSTPPKPSVPQQQRASTKAVTPVIDRSKKPTTVPSQHPASVPTVDRSKKPVMSASMYKKKLENLQPVFGSHGYALTGLRNLGNTCFMSCTLQCLNCTTPLVEYFITGKFRNDINHTNPLGRGGEVAEEFSFLVKAMWSGQYRSVSPRDFKQTICKIAPQFEGTAQQDSQELLAFLMDGLHEDLNRVKHKEVIEARDNRGVPDAQIARQSWEDHKKRNDSIIIDWFQGQFRSTVMCLDCKHRSVTFEAFMYLSLPIPPGTRRYTLQDCIQLFTKQEKIDSWVCLGCKRQNAVKKIEIWKLPRILIIILNRFRFEGVWREKRQNFIDFPLSSLDMTSNVVGVRPPGLYNLYAVSNHYGGTMSGGHYTAFCMNPYKKKFYCFDDHEVKDIRDIRDIRSNGAYVLFYTATDFSPPRML